MSNAFAATAVSSSGLQVLCFFMPNEAGDGYVLSKIVEVPGLGFVNDTTDLKIIDPRGEDSLREYIAEFGQRQADELVEKVEAVLEGMNEGEDGE